MKKNVLRGPLINSAIILAVLTLLLYMNSTDPDATLLNSIGQIFLILIRSIQWILAMSLGLIFCLAFLVAIFFAAAALFSPSEAVRMYQGFRQTLLSWLLPVQKQLSACSCTTGQESMRRDVKKKDDDIEIIRSQLHTTKEILTIKTDKLISRIDELEKMIAGKADSVQVEVLSDEVKGAVDSLAGIQGAVDSMQTCVEQTADQISGMSPEKILGDLPERVQAMEQKEYPEPDVIDISPLEKDIAGMQEELAQIRRKADKALLAAEDSSTSVQQSTVFEQEQTAQQVISTETSAQKEEEHRIFNYFDDPADKRKVADLVASTLKKDMSYKQVMDFVARELGPQKGKIISSHPSLSKDYIRQCRRKN